MMRTLLFSEFPSAHLKISVLFNPYHLLSYKYIVKTLINTHLTKFNVLIFLGITNS